MTDEQLISGAQALLDLDARGALVPHGIGGHARTIIEGFLALSSGGEYVPCIIRNDSAGFYEFVTEDVPALYGGMMAANVERIGKLQGGDLIGFRIYDETAPASPIVAAPEGWRTVPVEADGTMIRAGVDERDRPGSGAAVSKIYAAMLAAAPSIPEGVAAPEGLTPEKYAEQLAVSLREKHYPEVPQFEPMTGDVMGLLSQIDNMVAGLVRATAPEGKAEGGADRRPANCRNRLHDEGKAHPKSGCAVCKTGGITGCPYERPIPEGKAEPVTPDRISKLADVIENVTKRYAHPLTDFRVLRFDAEQSAAIYLRALSTPVQP